MYTDTRIQVIGEISERLARTFELYEPDDPRRRELIREFLALNAQLRPCHNNVLVQSTMWGEGEFAQMVMTGLLNGLSLGVIGMIDATSYFLSRLFGYPRT